MRPARPGGVSALAIISILFGLLLLLVGALLIWGGSSGMLTNLGYGSVSGTVTAIGAVLTVIGLLMVVDGPGLWTGKVWGWYLGLIIGALFVVYALYAIATGGSSTNAIVIIIALLIIWYLMRPGVKSYFGKGRPAEPSSMTTAPPPPPST